MVKNHIIIAYPREHGLPVYYYCGHEGNLVRWSRTNDYDVKCIKRLTIDQANDIVNELERINSLPTHRIISSFTMVN